MEQFLQKDHVVGDVVHEVVQQDQVQGEVAALKQDPVSAHQSPAVKKEPMSARHHQNQLQKAVRTKNAAKPKLSSAPPKCCRSLVHVEQSAKRVVQGNDCAWDPLLR